MFDEDKQAVISVVSNNTTLIQQSFNKITVDRKDNDHLNNITKETGGLKLSIETYQNKSDDEIKHVEKSIDKNKR